MARLAHTQEIAWFNSTPRYHYRKFKMRKRFKSFIFETIRPLYVKDIDINEDFFCMRCCEPVLGRTLYCSTKCYQLSTIEMGKNHE